jgi:GT2 family glycosyltransferase
MNQIAIITTCYNSNSSLQILADSIILQTVSPRIWILVDNSPLSNAIKIENTHLPIAVLNGEEGDGFGKGCNRGISYLHNRGWPGWVWFLNPDTQLSSPTLIEEFSYMLETLEDKSLVGTKVFNKQHELEESAGWIQKGLNYRSFQINRKHVNGELSPKIAVDWLSGCNLLYKPSAFSYNLCFDTHFPLYFEDIDFCLRSSFYGGKCFWMNNFLVYHQRGTGSTCSSFRRECLKTISQMRFLRRYQPLHVAILHLFRITFFGLYFMSYDFSKGAGTLCGVIRAFLRD